MENKVITLPFELEKVVYTISFDDDSCIISKGLVKGYNIDSPNTIYIKVMKNGSVHKYSYELVKSTLKECFGIVYKHLNNIK